MQNKNTQHGPGAAHIGFSMFGARGPLRSAEGDGAGAGTGNGESNAIVATNAASANTGDPGTAPGAASEKMLPQSQVNTLIANAKREAKEAARREIEAQQAQAAKPKEDPPRAPSNGSMSPEAVQQLIARERAFERGAAGIEGGRLARMEAAFRAENPPDVAAWTKAYREDMGFNNVTPPAVAAAPAVQPQQQASEAPKPPTAPSAPAASVSPTMQQGVVNLFALNEQQIAQLGPAGLREHFEAALSIGRQQAGVPQRPKAPARK